MKFDLKFYTKSNFAERNDIDNSTDNEDVIDNLKNLHEHIWVPIKKKFKTAYSNSFFRSLELNVRLGGSLKSQHMLGEAGDLETSEVSNYDFFIWCIENLTYDQIILEKWKSGFDGWVHISLKKEKAKNRKQCLKFDGKQYSLFKK